MNDDTLKQWQQDVVDYGDNAHQLYSYKVRGGDGNQTMPLESNFHIEFFGIEQYELVRKESAALPFDLERAKAGDVVEVYISAGFRWHDCKFEDLIINGDKGFIDGLGFCYPQDLRMKFPPKVKK